MESVISLKNKNDQTLYGILHIPNGAMKNVGIHLLNPGLKNRVAPNRLNVKLARLLCDYGFPVLRIDPQGIGDSEGMFMGSNEAVMDLWGAIQKGAFVEDTLIGNHYIASQLGIEKIIVMGQCGAAVTAGLVCTLDPNVQNLVLIDTPFRYVSSEIDISQAIIESYSSGDLLKKQIVGFFRFKWAKNIFNIKWYLQKIKVVTSIFKTKNKKSNTMNISERFSWKLADSLIEFMKSRKKICFLFAENDFALREFNSDFLPNFLTNSKEFENQYTVAVIKDANHIYSDEKWQQQLLRHIIQWIEKSGYL